MNDQYTPKYVSDMIDTVSYHQFPGTNVVACCITMFNGYSEVGTSACYDPSKFDLAVGEEMAHNAAMRKLRALENYRGRANRHESRTRSSGHVD